jgi:zinc transport system substrate-binding protein
MKKLFPILLFALTLTSCQANGNEVDSSKPTIYTSFYTIYDLAKRIVKDKANVINLCPSGTEPHEYTPTSQDIANLYDADLILINGINLESRTSNLPQEINNKIHIVTNNIAIEQYDGVNDPHVWLNPLNAVIEMKNITEILSNYDTENASFYSKSLANASYLFNSLNDSFTKDITDFKNKHILVSHAFLGYFCNQYGLTQIAINGLSSETEPTPKDVETIFVEDYEAPEIVKSIAKTKNCTISTLNPLETLTEEDQKTEDYISVMINNFNNLKEGSN